MPFQMLSHSLHFYVPQFFTLFPFFIQFVNNEPPAILTLSRKRDVLQWFWTRGLLEGGGVGLSKA